MEPIFGDVLLEGSFIVALICTCFIRQIIPRKRYGFGCWKKLKANHDFLN